MDLEVSTRRVGERVVVAVAGEVDLETASQMGDAALAAAQDSPHLVLDLAGVTFLDSTGLKVLLAVQRRAQLASGSLVLAGAPRPVLRILTLTGLEDAFTFYDSVGDLPAVIDDAGPTT